MTFIFFFIGKKEPKNVPNWNIIVTQALSEYILGIFIVIDFFRDFFPTHPRVNFDLINTPPPLNLAHH